MKRFIIPTIIILLALALGGIAIYRQVNPPALPVEPEPETVFCTADAMMCPDGSYVGRVAPSCAFAQCPTPTTESSLISSNSKAEIFLRAMKKSLNISSQIKNDTPYYKNQLTFSLQFPKELLGQAEDYFSTRLGSFTKATERGYWYENADIVCSTVGLSASAASGSLPYIWCADKI